MTHLQNVYLQWLMYLLAITTIHIMAWIFEIGHVDIQGWIQELSLGGGGGGGGAKGYVPACTLRARNRTHFRQGSMVALVGLHGRPLSSEWATLSLLYF